MLDFGFLLLHTFTNEAALAQVYGGALKLDKRCTTVREVVQVFADRPEVRQAVAKYGVPTTTYSGPPLVSDIAYEGTRERFRTGSIPLYYDNSQNAEYKEGDTWLNGASVTNTSYWYKRVDMPAGFNVIDSPTTANVGLNGFAHGYKRDSGDPYGGIMIGEFYCFTNTLETAERVELDRYLRVKWWANGFAEVTVDGGTEIAVDDDVRTYATTKMVLKGPATFSGRGELVAAAVTGVTNTLTCTEGRFVLPSDVTGQVPSLSFAGDGEIEVGAEGPHRVEHILASGTIEKSGDGGLSAVDFDDAVTNLVVSGGSLTFDPLQTLQSTLHLDAAATNTMTFFTEGSGEAATNFVSRWNDSMGGTAYLVNNGTTNATYRTDVKTRNPYLSYGLTATGLPLMDFGYLLCQSYTNEATIAQAHGAAMKFNASISCQELMMVAHQRPEVKTVVASNLDVKGEQSVPYVGNHDSYVYRGGKLANGSFPDYAWNNSQNYSIYPSGSVLRNLTTKENYDFPTSGELGVINFIMCYYGNKVGDYNRPVSKSFNSIGYSRGDADAPKAWGGVRYGEFMTFPARLTDADRARFYEALRVKWFGDARQTRAFTNVTVAAGAAFELPYRNLAVTDTLTLGGCVTCPAVSAANVVATGPAEIAGTTTLADGAVLTFAQQADGSWTSLAFESVVAEGAVTISIDLTNPKAACGQEVRLIAATDLPAAFETAAVICPEARAGVKVEVRADGLYATFGIPGLTILVH